jgi:hypothetical protein
MDIANFNILKSQKKLYIEKKIEETLKEDECFDFPDFDSFNLSNKVQLNFNLSISK